ncbi:hypothetical protein [Kurthia sp. Dielmo]|uniref:hypothetical protein n=1 Tax=Kurthia sp. Dielmo TaxID=1033738 RepID=UPI0011245CD6|nr:hypothetical protein [Kurthia sp. Dielmo]
MVKSVDLSKEEYTEAQVNIISRHKLAGNHVVCKLIKQGKDIVASVISVSKDGKNQWLLFHCPAEQHFAYAKNDYMSM